MSNYKQLLQKQRNCFATGKTRDLEYRKQQLLRLRQVVIEKYKDIDDALLADLGKCEFEAFAHEVTAMIDEINLAVEKLDEWVKPIDAPTSPMFGEVESRIYYEPYGTVLILNTWNYPFVLSFKPLVGALAAGNCCMVKPSEVAPATSRVLADIINTAFDEEYCVAIECGAEGAAELLKERFDFILYTGSAAVGRIVARAAAEHLTPTVLELGGKSPCIVDKSADIERSVATICWGKLINAGQTCTAPDYIWVHRERKDELVEALKQQIRRFYGDDIRHNNDFGRIINRRHFDRLRGLIEGENIVFGGETDEAVNFISPTILDNITWESRIMQEEVFGPIFPVMTFDSLEDVIQTLARRERPLALYLYTTDKSAEDAVVNNLLYGGGCINSTLMHMLNNNLPFGGLAQSGHGSYSGRWSVETFSHKKSILRRALSDQPSPLFPPYEDHVEFLKGIYLKS